GLTLEDRQWQDLFGVEKSVFEPALGACGAKAVPVVDDVHAAACGCIAAQRRIDKLPDQRDQRCADIADGQKQGAARPVRVPEVVSAHRRHAAGNVEPTWLKRPTLGTGDVQELAAPPPWFRPRAACWRRPCLRSLVKNSAVWPPACVVGKVRPLRRG